MKDQDILKIQQVETTVDPFRAVANQSVPSGGWVRAVREALGMTHTQLAKRLGKTQQTVERMQRSEAAGTIQLDTLRQLAEAMGCKLVYAVVPDKPLEDMRRQRAEELARKTLSRSTHSMKLEAQGVGEAAEQRAQERLVAKLLAGNPRRLWD